MISETLQQLGLSPKEIEVFLAVMRKARVLPAEVSKMTNLNRSTVYSIAAELKKRGLISEDLAGPVRYLVAPSPEDLKHLVESEERELEKKKKLIGEAITELNSFISASVYQPPKISFITQEELERFFYRRSEVWNQSASKYDSTWWGYQDNTLVDVYGAWIDWFWTSSVSKGIGLKLLSNKSLTEKEMEKRGFERRQIRFWSRAKDFTTSIWVVGDYLIMIMTREKPHYLVEINDAALAKNMRQVFKGIWEETQN